MAHVMDNTQPVEPRSLIALRESLARAEERVAVCRARVERAEEEWERTLSTPRAGRRHVPVVDPLEDDRARLDAILGPIPVTFEGDS